MNLQVLLNRLRWYQSKSQSPSQSGNRTCRTGSPWLAFLTLITRIEDGLTAQAFTTVPSGRRNAKLDIEVCRHRLADGAGVGSRADGESFCLRLAHRNGACGRGIG
jgi:hypothetical protein